MFTQIFALLDDCQSSSDNRSSIVFSDPVCSWKASTTDQIESTLESIQSQSKKGLHIVVLFSYELGEYFQGIDPTPSSTPFIEAYGFSTYLKLAANEVSDWIQAQLIKIKNSDEASGLIDIKPSISHSQYQKDIHEIHESISRGDVYQINHTFRLTGKIYGAPLKLYKTLRERQPVRWGSFISTGQRTVLSFSPELFLRIEGNFVESKPMKGTLSVHSGTAESLFNSEKNRAENLMITDLIRNDLGRFCNIGSVKVPKLFEVEKVGDIFQMTSTITGNLKTDIKIAEVLKSAFPCGSITGAPKKRAMEIIQTLESKPRGLYCGSIGYINPEGDLKLNVAIRTMEITKSNEFVMGIGSGITIDSNIKEEWNECVTKAKFVTNYKSSVGLIETMRCQYGKIQFLAEHLDRLKNSAKSLGIPFERLNIEKRVENIAYKLHSQQKNLKNNPKAINKNFILRLELQPSGNLVITHRPLNINSRIEKVFFARDLIGEEKSTMQSANVLLRHKTTAREGYELGWNAAVAAGGFDAIFTNQSGEITEGGRSNLFLKIGGAWLTPPIESGLLPGIMRKKLLDNDKWSVREQVLFTSDLINANEILLVNSVRGLIRAKLVYPVRS